MKACLLFDVRGTRYAVPACAVQTTFWLPALSPVEDLPPHVLGLVDLHGQVLPVVDLALRFGHGARPLREDQCVVLLQDGTRHVGVVADALVDLIEVMDEALDPYVPMEGHGPHAASVIAGTLRWDDRVLIRLDPAALMDGIFQRGAGGVATPDDDAPPANPEAPATPATPALAACGFVETDRPILRERARRLAMPPAVERSRGGRFLLLRLAQRRVAVDVTRVTELAHLPPVTPLPGAPPHVLGCTSVRGTLMTVLDIVPLLFGSPSPEAGDYGAMVVLPWEGHALALAVHEVLGLIEPEPEALVPLEGPAFALAHCRTLVLDADGAVGLLDLDTLLARQVIEVHDAS